MKFFILINLLFVFSAWSKSFEIEGKKFSLEFSSEWVDTEGLFDIPLTLSGPMANKIRPIITVTPTEMTKVKFNQKDKEAEADYQTERTRWLNKHNGKAQSFRPYQKLKWDGIEEAHSLGYFYSINGNDYAERTYYILCRDRLYHIKSLIQDIHFEYQDEIEKIVRSFRCQN